MSLWRKVAGVAILVVLLAAVVMLAPSYYRNFQLEQSLEEMAGEEAVAARTDEALRADIVVRAAALGIPLRSDQVRLDRTGGQLRFEARYIVRVDMPLYTVDLHFRAGSGAR